MLDYSKIHLMQITENNGVLTRRTVGIFSFQFNFDPAQHIDTRDDSLVLAAPVGMYDMAETVISKDEVQAIVRDSVMAGVLR